MVCQANKHRRDITFEEGQHVYIPVRIFTSLKIILISFHPNVWDLSKLVSELSPLWHSELSFPYDTGRFILSSMPHS